jgi:3-phenylpropionate/trans-cinnamate dioxygenase ferredoxin reductase subunit
MDTVRTGVAAGVRPDATIVIVGAGQAGGWAAHTLRDEGFAGRIVLVGAEPFPPYERPPLSKAVLAGAAPPESTQLFKGDAFAALALDWRPNTRATRIDRVGRRVEFSDGQAVSYDRLILCPGGDARALAVPGIDRAGVYTLRTLSDIETLAPVLERGRSLVVVGGGWIGLEVAATAREKGVDVTILEAQSRLCERTVPAAVSDYLLSLHRAHGARVLLEASITAFGRNEAGLSTVALANGDPLQADAIFVGVGLAPNDALAREAGLACDGGVIVDAACRTSDPDILAAGDVAVAWNPWAGRRLRLESWQNAQNQAIAVARNILGANKPYAEVPWFWSDQFGHNLQIAGEVGDGMETIGRGTPGQGAALRFYLADGVLRGAIGIDAARDLRFAKELIGVRARVAADALADPGVKLAELLKQAKAAAAA